MSVVDGRQLKAGRVILGLTVQEMAGAAGIHRNSVIRVEKHKTLPYSAYAADKIRDAQEALGLAFIVEDGKAGVFFQAAQRRCKTPYSRHVPPN